MKEVFVQTNKSLSRSGLYRVKQSIKKESLKWYMKLASDKYEYFHGYKERIDEIIWLQRKHHEIVDNFKDNAKVMQDSLEELHKLNVTLSNYLDVAPELVTNHKTNISALQYYERGRELANVKEELEQLKSREKEREREKDSMVLPQIGGDTKNKQETDKGEQQELICYCGDSSIMNHYECSNCGHVWCVSPEDKTLTLEQQKCPKCSPFQAHSQESS